MESDSGSTSESDSDGPATAIADHDAESDLEEGEEEDNPLMEDPMTACNVCDYSYLNEDNVKELKIAQEYKCSLLQALPVGDGQKFCFVLFVKAIKNH